MFQSTPPRRGRRNSTGPGASIRWFQSTPPRRGRLGGSIPWEGNTRFQSTPPRRGRLLFKLPRPPPHSFNPRPRAGGDPIVTQHPPHLTVSIHAPAQGATHNLHGFDLGHVVSIHAPAQGATSERVPVPSLCEFQSTPPRRGRRGRQPQDRTSRAVSIHAPAQGATEILPLLGTKRQGFNPRPRAGGDL